MLLKCRFSSISSKPQLYGIATYEALLKYVLNEDTIRSSFFHAFIPGLSIVSSKRLDDHINSPKHLQLLPTFLHSKETENASTLFGNSTVQGSNVTKETAMLNALEKKLQGAGYRVNTEAPGRVTEEQFTNAFIQATQFLMSN
jgi:hypothetical protein